MTIDEDEDERIENLRRKNDNRRDPIEQDCREQRFSGVRGGETRIPRLLLFKEVSPKEATIFLMRAAGFKSKDICPIFKISPKTITRTIKRVYAKYPRLKNI